MQKEFSQITSFWKEMYSRQIKKYQPFEVSNDFKRFASLFAPGNSYFYIVNLYDFKLEYISDSVERFIGKEPGSIDMKDLLQTVTPGEIEIISLKSKVISDFYNSFLPKDDVLNYKNIFSYSMTDANGGKRTMLYQAFPLSVLEDGTPEHVFCIQTDVSHLKVTSTDTVSFVHMNGGKSYYNVNISNGEFIIDRGIEDNQDLSTLLTEREKQIVMELSKGSNAEQIAFDLNVSPHTVKTHRRNILRKTRCSNTTELVVKCLTNGIISPQLN